MLVLLCFVIRKPLTEDIMTSRHVNYQFQDFYFKVKNNHLDPSIHFSQSTKNNGVHFHIRKGHI